MSKKKCCKYLRELSKVIDSLPTSENSIIVLAVLALTKTAKSVELSVDYLPLIRGLEAKGFVDLDRESSLTIRIAGSSVPVALGDDGARLLSRVQLDIKWNRYAAVDGRRRKNASQGIAGCERGGNVRWGSDD